jgi:hypothetical protein
MGKRGLVEGRVAARYGLPRRSSLKRCACLRAPACDEICSRHGLGQRVRLPGPQVDSIGICGGARGCAKGRGQVVDLRVSLRRRGVVVAHETVDDSASAAAAEGACQGSRSSTGECCSVWRARSGLRGQHQTAPDLSGRRARRDDAGDSLAVGDPARGHEREMGRVAHELEQGEEADGRRVGVVERALVTTGL